MSKPFKCKNCEATLDWPDPYVEGCRPFEVGTTTEHNCPGLKKNSPGKGFASAKFPYDRIDELVEKTEAILASFKKKRNIENLPPNDEAIFFESVFRTISQNFKP